MSIDQSIDTISEDGYLYFDVQLNEESTTKATVTTSENQLETLKKFGVYAINLNGGDYFLENERINYNSNTSQWVSVNPVGSWPSGGALFYGYAPYANPNVASSTTADGDLLIEFNNEELASDQVDLMVTEPKSVTSEGCVNLSFNHTLSAIAFKFSGDGTIKVKSVGFKGVYGSGELTATSEGERSWNDRVFDEETIYRMVLSSNNTPLTGVPAVTSADGDYLMMIPTNKEAFENMDIVVTLASTVADMENVVSLDMPTDLDWEANNIYTYTMDLADMDVINFDVEVNPWDDGLGDIDTDIDPELGALELSNCYMLNSGLTDKVFYIPVDGRIKDFYEGYMGYKNETLRKYTLEIGDEYTPFMIWYVGDDSFEAVIDDFVIKPLTTAELLAVERNERVMPTCTNNFLNYGCKAALKIVVPEAAKEGSILVGLKKEVDGSEVLLWSWHLWITEYDPNGVLPTATTDDRVYDVTNGEVHRYTDSDSQNPAVWGAGGIYENSYIMDRNIGARYVSRVYSEGDIFYYQFGRKDPIPVEGYYANYCDVYIYSSSSMYSNGNTGIAKGMLTSVKNPTTIWVNVFSNGSPSWNEDDASFDEDATWNDSGARHDLYTSKYSVQKSIFDPSPLGWKIPVSAVWSNFPESFTSSDIYKISYDDRYSTEVPDTYDFSFNLWILNGYEDGMMFNYKDFTHFPETGVEYGYTDAGTGGYDAGKTMYTSYHYVSALWSCTNSSNYTSYNSQASYYGGDDYRAVPSQGYYYRMICSSYTSTSITTSSGLKTSRRNGAMPIRCVQEQY